MNTAHMRGERRVDSNVVLLLSLKLILLAFFILLTALSEFEVNRTEAVLKSVNRTFNGKVVSVDKTVSPMTSVGLLSEAEELVREFGSLFEAMIPSARNKETKRSTSIRAEMPASALFKNGRSQLFPARIVLIRRLAKVLKRERTGLTYEIEILHGIGATADSVDQSITKTAQSLEARRVNALARRLLGKGLAPEQISIGLAPGRPGIVEFVLRVRDRAAAADAPPEDEG